MSGLKTLVFFHPERDATQQCAPEQVRLHPGERSVRYKPFLGD